MTRAPSERLADVLAEIGRERERQIEKWGVQTLDPPVWLMVLGEEVGEANQAALEHLFPVLDKGAAQYGPKTLEAYRTELVQVAAVAVAAIESLDRQRAGQGNSQP